MLIVNMVYGAWYLYLQQRRVTL